MIPHPRLAAHHLRTYALPDGWLLSTFAPHASPGYETVVRHCRKAGGDVRRYGWCGGNIEIKWRQD